MAGEGQLLNFFWDTVPVLFLFGEKRIDRGLESRIGLGADDSPDGFDLPAVRGGVAEEKGGRSPDVGFPAVGFVLPHLGTLLAAVEAPVEFPHVEAEGFREVSQPGDGQGFLVFEEDVAGEPYKGKRNAKITLVEFSDYQCPTAPATRRTPSLFWTRNTSEPES